MALYLRINPLVVLCTSKLTTPLLALRSFKTTVFKEEDPLEQFTGQLVEKKANKWKSNIKKGSFNKTKLVWQDPIPENICDLSIDNINVLFQNAIDVEDNVAVYDLIKQCIRHNKCPTLSILIYVLQLCSSKGDKDMINEIRLLCELSQPKILKENSNFVHYLAEALWMKGNITKSLDMFEKVYRENVYLRRRIRLTLRYLIIDVVASRSEAVLLSIVKFTETLYQEFKDYYLITCIWEVCFLSEWFTDQCIALDLLDRNDGLCRYIVDRIPYVVKVSLRSHRSEAVYRLLELLLKYNMREQYGGVLTALLDYQIKQRDLRSCLEIVQWSLKNDVELPTILHKNFIHLVLKNNNSLQTSIQKNKVNPSSYKF